MVQPSGDERNPIHFAGLVVQPLAEQSGMAAKHPSLCLGTQCPGNILNALTIAYLWAFLDIC